MHPARLTILMPAVIALSLWAAIGGATAPDRGAAPEMAPTAGARSTPAGEGEHDAGPGGPPVLASARISPEVGAMPDGERSAGTNRLNRGAAVPAALRQEGYPGEGATATVPEPATLLLLGGGLLGLAGLSRRWRPR